jgi:hypothetical protein
MKQPSSDSSIYITISAADAERFQLMRDDGTLSTLGLDGVELGRVRESVCYRGVSALVSLSEYVAARTREQFGAHGMHGPFDPVSLADSYVVFVKHLRKMQVYQELVQHPDYHSRVYDLIDVSRSKALSAQSEYRGLLCVSTVICLGELFARPMVENWASDRIARSAVSWVHTLRSEVLRSLMTDTWDYELRRTAANLADSFGGVVEFYAGLRLNDADLVDRGLSTLTPFAMSKGDHLMSKVHHWRNVLAAWERLVEEPSSNRQERLRHAIEEISTMEDAKLPRVLGEEDYPHLVSFMRAEYPELMCRVERVRGGHSGSDPGEGVEQPEPVLSRTDDTDPSKERRPDR